MLFVHEEIDRILIVRWYLFFEKKQKESASAHDENAIGSIESFKLFINDRWLK